MGNIVSQKVKDDVLPIVPDDIIMGNILTRLPVKSLVRFRCVCKSWRYLLSHDPDFVQSHLNFNSLDLHNGKIISRCKAYVPTKKFHPLKSLYLHLGGSVNGLVCVFHHDWTQFTYIGICNPATNQCKDIPIPSRASCKLHFDSCSLAIGFDSIDNDYKLIFVTMFSDQRPVADVYSCNTCSWRKDSVVSSLLLLDKDGSWTSPTIVKGCPYWYNCKIESFKYYCVVCFDVHNEVFRFFPGIQIVDINTQYQVMVNWKDSLAFIVHDHPWLRSRSPSVHVYIFDELCGDWIKNYSIKPITIPRYMKFIHCFRNGDLLYCDGQHINVVSVNSESHKSDGLYAEWCSCHYVYCKFSLPRSFDHLETLVSVKGMYPLRDCKAGPDILIIEKSV